MSNNILNAAFVSCDIVGHGKVHDHEIQKNRIQKINDIIEKVCRGHFGKGIVWASGGDGGHVAFFHESMRGMTIRLIKDLFQWADESSKGGDSDLKLRLTAHFGPVSTIVGADKRDQLVGNGINFCGSLLSFGAPGSVIVSSDFKNFVNRGRRQNDELVDRTRFHDEHSVYIKHFQIHRISFMSIDGEFESKRRSPEKSDQIHLDEARKDKEGEINLAWQIIYHAKRLLQIDSSNDKAKMAIRAILPNRLHFKQFIVRNDFMEEIVNQSHPLFWRVERNDVLEPFINAAQMIEREDGDVICKKGESGDTMFIVLRGQVGVLLGEDNDPNHEDGFHNMVDLRFGEGAVLGELALALKCERTATLQAIGPTALLTINYKELRTLLENKPKNKAFEDSFEYFIKSRLLEYLCRRVPYLSVDQNGPLTQVHCGEPWKILVDHSQRIDRVRKDRIISPTKSPFNEPGLFILIYGRVKMASEKEGVVNILDGHDFPLLFVDIPDELVSVRPKYQIISDNISIIRISDDALEFLELEAESMLKQAVIRQLSSQFIFDAFISYDFNDKRRIEDWETAMKNANLNVYISKPIAGELFIEEINLAIATSRTMIPFVSSHVSGTDNGESWVEKEIMTRMQLFNKNHCNIIPIELEPDAVKKVPCLDGITPIPGWESVGGAVQKAIEKIKEYCKGVKPPPYNSEKVNLDDVG